MKFKHRAFAIATAVITVLAYPHARAEFDLGIETEAAFVDSEGALAAEEEGRRAAEEEKRRLAQEKEIRGREEKKAREMEAKAKVQIAKWNEEAKLYRTERIQHEKKTAIAKEKQLALDRELQAKQAEVQALHDVVEQTIAERDQKELMVEQAQDKIARVEQKMAEEKKRRTEALAGLAKANANLEASKLRLKELRKPANVSTKATKRVVPSKTVSKAPKS